MVSKLQLLRNYIIIIPPGGVIYMCGLFWFIMFDCIMYTLLPILLNP